MKLTHSAWINCATLHLEQQDYLLFLPEHGLITSFNWIPPHSFIPGSRKPPVSHVVWCCWIQEEENSVAYTALRGAARWRRESYRIVQSNLHWSNPSGESVWQPIEESEIPATLLARVERAIEFLHRFPKPPYPNPDEAEQPVLDG